MMGAKCHHKRKSATVVVKGPTSIAGSPAKFDGRENKGGPPLKSTASPIPKGGPQQATRLS